MADAVTSQTILDGERLFIGKFTNLSDGTGETAVVKIDVSTLRPNAAGNACNGVKINKIWSTTHGLQVRILFDATGRICLDYPAKLELSYGFFDIWRPSEQCGCGRHGRCCVYHSRFKCWRFLCHRA